MINWKTILSSFDDKPTLMQWLKIVEKALQNASLENVTIKLTGNNTFVFEFKFADGSTVTSTPLNFPKDISGIEEVSDEIVGTQTLTTLRAHYTDGTTDEFPVYAENGKDGKEGKAGKGVSRFEDISDEIVGNQTYTTVRVHYTDGTTEDINVAAENGKGIREISSVSNKIVGNQTVTTIRVYYTDGTAGDFSVYAENGSGGGSKVYMHKIAGQLTDTENPNFNIVILSSDNTKITTPEELVTFYKNNQCVLTTLEYYPVVIFNVFLGADKIALNGLNFSSGKKISGNVTKIIGDQVLGV